jgi:hypothetical protein
VDGGLGNDAYEKTVASGLRAYRRRLDNRGGLLFE